MFYFVWHINDGVLHVALNFLLKCFRGGESSGGEFKGLFANADLSNFGFLKNRMGLHEVINCLLQAFFLFLKWL